MEVIRLPSPATRGKVPVAVGKTEALPRSTKKAPVPGVGGVPGEGARITKVQFGDGPNVVLDVPNMKQPPTPGVLDARSKTKVHVVVPSVIVKGVNAGVPPLATKVGTVKENENALIPPVAPMLN